MKKIISLILVVITLVCALTACTRFGKEPKAYAKELKEKGFYVELYDADDTYESIGIYSIAESFDIEDYASWIDYIVFCENEEEGYFFYCHDTKAAKNIKKELEELTEKYKGYADAVVKRQGKIVYFGAEENWKDI